MKTAEKQTSLNSRQNATSDQALAIRKNGRGNSAVHWIIVLMCLNLTACAEGSPELPPQYWRDVKIDVLTRPNPVRIGLNEFLVVVTRPDDQPAHDFIVSLRTKEDAGWLQAIQDGFTGIYRRSLRIEDSNSPSLWVRLEGVRGRSGYGETVLKFPLISTLHD